jgi:hypothetical protein
MVAQFKAGDAFGKLIEHANLGEPDFTAAPPGKNVRRL